MRCASCGNEAKEIYPLTNTPLCWRHAGALRKAVVMLVEDTETIVKHLAAGYVPEMRQHDEGMLRRIADQEIDETERVEIRLHLTARKIAAHAVLSESHAFAVA